MEQFDAVIIGSGAGGAPVAWELARAGKNVLVLEKGPRLRTQEDSGAGGLSDFKRDEVFSAGPEKIITLDGVANKGRAFFASHLEPDLNDEPQARLQYEYVPWRGAA